MKKKCILCGKEFADVPGIPGEKRLMRHISAVHGRYEKYLDQVEKEAK